MPSSPAARAIGPDQIRPLRRVEYDQLVALGAFAEERLELLEGALVAMSPQHAPHAATIARLTKLLVRRISDRYELRFQLPLAIADATGHLLGAAAPNPRALSRLVARSVVRTEQRSSAAAWRWLGEPASVGKPWHSPRRRPLSRRGASRRCRRADRVQPRGMSPSSRAAGPRRCAP